MKFKKLKNSELLRKSIDEFKRSEKIPLTIVIDNWAQPRQQLAIHWNIDRTYRPEP